MSAGRSAEPAAITVWGAGSAGLVCAAGFAQLGHAVLCVDVQGTRVVQLGQARLPFFEPGLEDLLVRHGQAGRLRFAADVSAGVAHGEVHLLALDIADGDAAPVLAIAARLGEALRRSAVVACRSHVPVGTGDAIDAAIRSGLRRAGRTALEVPVVANPAFLRRGQGVADMLHPDRVVVGSDDARALALMKALHAPLLREPGQWVPMSRRCAEFTGHASNAMLAARLSLMNDLARLAEQAGADIEAVRRGIGADRRVGEAYLAAGCGFGGPGLMNSLRALRQLAARHAVELPSIDAAESSNLMQRGVFAQRAARLLDGRARRAGRASVALWGLAYKPDTDELHDAPGAAVIDALLRAGAHVRAHDPVAMPAARRCWSDQPRLTFAPSALEAVQGAEALVIVTDWPEYQRADWPEVRRRMARPVVLDGRNLCDPSRMATLGFRYAGTGRGPARATVAAAVR